MSQNTQMRNTHQKKKKKKKSRHTHKQTRYQKKKKKKKKQIISRPVILIGYLKERITLNTSCLSETESSCK